MMLLTFTLCIALAIAFWSLGQRRRAVDAAAEFRGERELRNRMGAEWDIGDPVG